MGKQSEGYAPQAQAKGEELVTDTQIQDRARPMIAPHEVIQYAASAIVSWTNEAATRDVTLLEHDSTLAGVIAITDAIANPRAFAAERASLFQTPYATIPYYDPTPVPAGLTGAGAPRGWREIPAVGVYQRPTETEASKWWDALTAWTWRLADLTTESAATGATVLPADAMPVAVFGESAEATVTTPGRKFREHVETVRAARPLIAGAYAFIESRRGGLTAAQTDIANTMMRDALALRDALAKEKAQVSSRGTMRAVVTLGVAIGGAYAYSKM